MEGGYFMNADEFPHQSNFITTALHDVANARLLLSKSIKGYNFVKKPCRVMALNQLAALVMLNKCIKIHKICFMTFKVVAKAKVCHNDNDDDNDTRVMTIP